MEAAPYARRMLRTRYRVRRLLAVVAVAVTCAACSPLAAIGAAFGRHGPAVVAEAVEVAECESGLDPSARNGDHAGLFQLRLRFHRHRIDGDPYDALANAVGAERLYVEQGWSPWSCKP